jgi:FKBP-type peptidyl-prolyl cis-trans isomerase FklB
MKRIVIFIIFLFATTHSILAQNKTNIKPNKTTQKNTVETPELKTLLDSASYAIGLSVINFYKQQEAGEIKASVIAKAISDVQTGKKLLFDDARSNSVIMAYLNKQQAKKSKPNIEAGEKFLTENKKRKEVITTATGLQYEILTQGSGAKPTTADTVVCNYKGTFLNGNVFDDSYSRGMPIEFPVTGVIKGWTEILQLMPAGSKYKAYIPYQLGYGASGYGSIPGGSLLIFEIELLKVKGKQ